MSDPLAGVRVLALTPRRIAYEENGRKRVRRERWQQHKAQPKATPRIDAAAPLR